MDGKLFVESDQLNEQQEIETGRATSAWRGVRYSVLVVWLLVALYGLGTGWL